MAEVITNKELLEKIGKLRDDLFVLLPLHLKIYWRFREWLMK
jgi:hypothetical protein